MLRHSLVTWDILKRAFVDKLFMRELVEAKVEEFINILQGGMGGLNYSLNLLNGPSMILPCCLTKAMGLVFSNGSVR